MPGDYVVRVRAENAVGSGGSTGDSPAVTITRTRITPPSPLLVGQWRNSVRLRGVVELVSDVVREELETPLNELIRQRRIETATGVWLDAIGARLGVTRPSTTEGATDPRFGFDLAGEGFDVSPFAGDAVSAARVSLGDVVYRRLVRARAIMLVTDGTLAMFTQAIAAIDPSAAVADTRDMSVVVTTGRGWQITLADVLECLPRPAGVRLIVRDRDVFGFDDAGVGFDLGPFRA